MSEHLLTGNEMIDSLQGLQRVNDYLDDVDEKVLRMRQGVHLLGAQQLLARTFMISTSLALGKSPDSPPDAHVLFSNGMMVAGEIDEFSYLNCPEIPLDSLTIGIVRPQLFGAEDEEAQAFSEWRLRVPVLAIDTCLSLEL